MVESSLGKLTEACRCPPIPACLETACHPHAGAVDQRASYHPRWTWSSSTGGPQKPRLFRCGFGDPSLTPHSPGTRQNSRCNLHPVSGHWVRSPTNCKGPPLALGCWPSPAPPLSRGQRNIAGPGTFRAHASFFPQHFSARDHGAPCRDPVYSKGRQAGSASRGAGNREGLDRRVRSHCTRTVPAA